MPSLKVLHEVSAPVIRISPRHRGTNWANLQEELKRSQLSLSGEVRWHLQEGQDTQHGRLGLEVCGNHYSICKVMPISLLGHLTQKPQRTPNYFN